MPVVFEYSGLDTAVLVALRVAAVATFSLAAAVLVGVAAWVLCCRLEVMRGRGRPGSARP